MDQNQKKQPVFLPRKGSLNLRLIGGGYLLYLCYQLGKGLSEAKQNDKLIMMAAIVVFAVVGVIIVVTSLKALKEGRFVGGAMDHSEENTEIPVEEISGKMSTEEVTGEILGETPNEISEETIEAAKEQENKEKTEA